MAETGDPGIGEQQVPRQREERLDQASPTTNSAPLLTAYGIPASAPATNKPMPILGRDRPGFIDARPRICPAALGG